MTKEERAIKAVAHHKLMSEIFSDEDYDNWIYEGNKDIMWSNFYERTNPINIEVTDRTTVDELFNRIDLRAVGILNFASFLSPGGGFIHGAIAQEEDLCHHSNLYEHLIQEYEYYEDNLRHSRHGAYMDRAIMSRDVTFTKKAEVKNCDVITCSAPNKSLTKFGEVEWDNNRVLFKRIQFFLNVAEGEAIKNLILGAWGCGVFEQNPYDVALGFKKALENKYYEFENVIFAIPPGKNYDVFKEVFHDCKTI